MKKAFDQNVSRAKPRLRLGAAFATPEAEETESAIAEEVELEVAAAPSPAPPLPAPDLHGQVKARAAASRQPRPTATEAVQRALLDEEPEPAPTPRARAHVGASVVDWPEVPRAQQSSDGHAAAWQRAAPEPVAHADAPPEVTEVQTPAPPVLDPSERRERLKERLKAVRENPRPEPLPATVAEAGVRVVERISVLQAELAQVKSLNLALTQDLEGTRRQAERATEEARLRMDEAQRLATEMEGRAKLLSELERELSSLEGERDEALLSLQEARQTHQAHLREQDALKAELEKRDHALAESLSEEERLAAELEAAQDGAAGLRRALDTMSSERDTLARQVSDLTRERAELLEARKALEAVHRALSTATVR
jgi:hypothetical protein